MTKIGNQDLQSVKIEIQDLDDLTMNQSSGSNWACNASASESKSAAHKRILKGVASDHKKLRLCVAVPFSMCLLISALGWVTGLFAEPPLSHICASSSGSSIAAIMSNDFFKLSSVVISKNGSSYKSACNYKLRWPQVCMSLFAGALGIGIHAHDKMYESEYSIDYKMDNPFYLFSLSLLMTLFGLALLHCYLFSMHSLLKYTNNRNITPDVAKASTTYTVEGLNFFERKHEDEVPSYALECDFSCIDQQSKESAII